MIFGTPAILQCCCQGSAFEWELPSDELCAPVANMHGLYTYYCHPDRQGAIFVPQYMWAGYPPSMMARKWDSVGNTTTSCYLTRYVHPAHQWRVDAEDTAWVGMALENRTGIGLCGRYQSAGGGPEPVCVQTVYPLIPQLGSPDCLQEGYEGGLSRLWYPSVINQGYGTQEVAWYNNRLRIQAATHLSYVLNGSLAGTPHIDYEFTCDWPHGVQPFPGSFMELAHAVAWVYQAAPIPFEALSYPQSGYNFECDMRTLLATGVQTGSKGIFLEWPSVWANFDWGSYVRFCAGPGFDPVWVMRNQHPYEPPWDCPGWDGYWQVDHDDGFGTCRVQFHTGLLTPGLFYVASVVTEAGNPYGLG